MLYLKFTLGEDMGIFSRRVYHGLNGDVRKWLITGPDKL